MKRPEQEMVFIEKMDDLRHRAIDYFKEGDLILCLGAGSITGLPSLMVKDLSSGDQDA